MKNLRLSRLGKSLLILCVAIGGGLCLAKDSAPPSTGPAAGGPEPRGLQCVAQLFVQINRDLAAKNAVSQQSITDALSRFYDQHDRFRAADLERVEVPDINGKSVRLKDIATVDVVLSRAK
jgi:hypothetical protein